MYPSTQTCPRCQSPVAPGATVCGNCGQSLSASSSPYGPPPGASYGTLPAPDPYASGGGNYNANQPPTYYNSPGGMGSAPTAIGSAYAPEPPPPPPGGGYPGSQPQGGYPQTMQAAYPSSGPSAYPGSMPPPPAFPGSSPAYPGSQPQGGFPGGGFGPSFTTPQGPPPSGGSGKKIALIVVAVLLVLGAVGGGVGYYLLSRPKPTITVTSTYNNGSTPVGADGTSFQVKGQKFSANSSITFLLDGQTAPGSAVVQSDSNGDVTTTLKVSKDWAVNKHTLTAKDAKDYVTQTGVSIEIVKPGFSKTPGPNGAPTNSSAAFTINATVTFSDGSTLSRTLTFTPKDDAGGTICQPRDDGAQHTLTGTFNQSTQYTELVTYQCKGTYANGHINYQEIATQSEFDFDNGIQCHATTPYNEEVYVGDFSDPTTVSGTWSADSITFPDCTFQGSTLVFKADSATWTGTLAG